MEGRGASEEPSPVRTDAPAPESGAAKPKSWGYYWLYILGMGVGVSLLGASLLIWLQAQLGFTFWSVCCSLPLVFGLLIVAIAAWSTHAMWVHVRVTDLDDRRRNVAVSLPLPLTLTILALRIMRRFAPNMPDQGIEEMISALRDGRRADGPLVAEVYDDKERKHVQVRVG
jgi:H+/Cl- antiporter ClcA